MPFEDAESQPEFVPTQAPAAVSDFGPSAMESRESRSSEWPVATVATFLYARLHNFAAACQAMSATELTAFVNDVRHMLSDAVVKLGGEIAQRRPDSILAVFSNAPEARKPDHAQRGLHAAILAVHEAVQLATRIGAQPDMASLPPLTLAVGVHLGAADVTPRANGAKGMVTAVGEAVELARLLEVTATDLHWSIATSAATSLAAAGRAEKGRIGSLGLPDESFIDIVEVTGLVPRRGSQTPPRMFELLRDSIAANQQWRKRSTGGASVTSPAAAIHPGSHLLVEGYRVLRKIGEGGMASIFLAEAGDGGPPQVLKVVRMDASANNDSLQRFIQEFALLEQVSHPNVARIFRQDFSLGHAYIAMEYFPSGDLAARLRRPLDARTAIDYLKQTAAGLGAIHAVGIVHRDLKPDNLMLRQDGSLALADFGVAKQVSMLITDTGDGDIVGTPYYLSPEQATGQPVDARCDLYSLGVMAYEMLTGRKPYHANTAQELLSRHVNDPVPVLGAPHEHLQPVLERMMAKDRDQRYPSASALLDDLQQRGI
ncbi:protein kinase [Caenimonas terrae]|uniref:Protein kinase n=1 Tax=Caenimonas terrae TaxID=696074 RepID=A0ABW0ND35_9BURK